jgi:hypothetical protein
MRLPVCRLVTVTCGAAAVCVFAVGCSGAKSGVAPEVTATSANSTWPPLLTSIPTATTARAPDYTHLLLKGAEVGAPGAAYPDVAPNRDPKGVGGAEVLMVNDDQARAIGITVVVLADIIAARSQLPKAKPTLRRS